MLMAEILHQLIGSLSHLVLYIPGGAGFLPSTVLTTLASWESEHCQKQCSGGAVDRLKCPFSGWPQNLQIRKTHGTLPAIFWWHTKSRQNLRIQSTKRKYGGGDDICYTTLRCQYFCNGIPPPQTISSMDESHEILRAMVKRRRYMRNGHPTFIRESLQWAYRPLWPSPTIMSQAILPRRCRQNRNHVSQMLQPENRKIKGFIALATSMVAIKGVV